ncbi:MAG: PDZ domain-containing protein [Phycisphaerales bacterium]|nr:PDZ domain-containing protein [Phycisphaerales bacterium]
MPRITFIVALITATISVIVVGCASDQSPGVGEVGAAGMDVPPVEVAEVVAAVEPVEPVDPAVSVEPVAAAEAVALVEPAPVDPVPPTPVRNPRIDVEFVGEEVRVSIDGQRVAKEHLRRTESAIEIISSAGVVLQTIAIPQPTEHPPVMIGVRFETPGKALAKHLPGDASKCAIVVAVLENSPGYVAGVEDFDLVTAIDGKSPASPADIRQRLAGMTAGESIVLTIRRGTTTKDFTIATQPWKHVPLPAPLQPPPFVRGSSPTMPPVPGTPNAPNDKDARGRPAAAPQRSATTPK